MSTPIFESAFEHAMDSLKGRLMQTATLTYAVDATTVTLSVSFIEQVGFVDDRLRAVFTFDADDVTTELQRGDFFVLEDDTQRWYAVDIRDDKAGGIEVRCDAYLERL